MKTCNCDKTVSLAMTEDVFFGQINDPTAAATITGPCGDTMEVYLVVRDDVIQEIGRAHV